MAANAPALNELSNRILGCALTGARTLGCGRLARVHQNALAHELHKAGLAVTRHPSLTVRYDGVIVGEYVADLLVRDAILVELMTARALNDTHRAQCLTDLRATGLHLRLLLDCGAPRLEIRRVVRDLQADLSCCVFLRSIAPHAKEP